MNIGEEDLLEPADAPASYQGMARAGRSTKIGRGVYCLAEKLNIKGN